MSITTDEYRSRIERLAAVAGAAGLDGVLLTAESNIDYFSGYRHHAPWTLFARPFVEVVSAGGEAVLVGHSFLAPEMERTSAVRDIRAYSKSGGGLDAVLGCLRELGFDRGRLGMELGDEQRLGVTQLEFDALRASLENVEVVDAAPLLWRLRMIKSPAEQALMRESAAITARAMAAGFRQAAPGVTEREVARAVGETMMREGADRPGFIVMVSGADNHHVLSGKPTDRALESGDMLWMDLGSVYRGYWSDFCRACVVGGPTRAQRDAQAVIVEVNQACVDAVRPGEPIHRVPAAAEAAFARLGMDVKVGPGRIGHGMGLMSTESPHVALRRDDHDAGTRVHHRAALRERARNLQLRGAGARERTRRRTPYRHVANSIRCVTETRGVALAEVPFR